MQLLNKNERELVKLANFFIKNTENLVSEGKLEEEHNKVVAACNTLIEKIYLHAEDRDTITKNRESLKSLIKDNASCPRCNSNTHLKIIGVDTEEKWKCNRYKCRRCNIQFTWNRPNNPWDMIPFTEALISELENKIASMDGPEDAKEQIHGSLDMMKANLLKIKEVVESSDEEYQDMLQRDLEMSRMVHEFKNFLMIEKIKLDTWKNPFSDN
ncbi:MAG TPA: hypothetical protein VD908_18760 [Cytophagales bacterium]|nr:hypothetical protein [Cytophagales bacterium]